MTRGIKLGLGLLAAAALALPARGAAPAAGITISPPFVQLNLTPGQVTASYPLVITNHYSYFQSFNLSSINFDTENNYGDVAFEGQTPTDFEKKYGLKDWITPSPNAVTLGPGQSATITVAVTNDASLAPGGHYGAVLINAVSPSTPQSSNTVTVVQSLSSLIFVDKTGGAVFGLNLTATQVKHDVLNTLSVAPAFTDTGNVHEVPRGYAELLNPLGKVVARGSINDQSALILPGTTRIFPTQLIRTGSFVIPGRYQLVVHYRYDGTSNFRVAKVTVAYANPLVLWALVLAVLGLAGWAAWAGLRTRR